MVNFTDNEKKFIKRVMVVGKSDLGIDNINVANKEDLLSVISHYRAKGYIIPRRMDNGKDFELYYQILEKLGKSVKRHDKKIIEQAEEHAVGIINRLNEAHDSKINHLQSKLEIAKKDKEDAINKIEQEIQDQVNSIEQSKQEALQRLEVAKTAKKRLAKIHADEKKKKDEELIAIDRAVKCWICGEVFKSGAGLASHNRSKHPQEVV